VPTWPGIGVEQLSAPTAAPQDEFGAVDELIAMTESDDSSFFIPYFVPPDVDE